MTTCQECRHFQTKTPGDPVGRCTIRLPPWAEYPTLHTKDGATTHRTVTFSQGCHLGERRAE